MGSRSQDHSEAPGSEGSPIGRRVFLGILGLGAAGVAAGTSAQAAVGRIVSPIVQAAGNGLGALLPGANRFRIYTVTSGYPVESDSAYRLEIGGLVRKPTTLTLADLKQMPPTRLVKDFQCVTGWRVPDVPWVGVRLSDLVALAEPTSEAKAVEFHSFDGVYTESLTLDQADRYDVIVAYEMLGTPLSTEHGGPVRLYVAPMYGYKSCKWLRSIELVAEPAPGFWEQEGYDINAWIGESNGESNPPVDGR